MPLPTDKQLEELRESIRKRFLDRGWDSLNGYRDSVNSFTGGQKEKAKEFYSKSVVIHYPYFYNSMSICRKYDRVYNDNDFNNMWNKTPEKMDRFVLEIILDIIVDFIRKYQFHPGYEKVIIFQHYGTHDYAVDRWLKDQRDYHININGKIRKI